MCLVNETVHYTTDCSFLSLPLQQEIAMVISSPFLRCLQTAQQACNALELPGVHTFNGLCEIVAPECNMRGAPKVPAMADVEACGITLINVDSSPFAGYPEKVTDAIARCVSQEQRIGLVEQSWLWVPHTGHCNTSLCVVIPANLIIVCTQTWVPHLAGSKYDTCLIAAMP